ncbi:hypothetical protein PR048_019927 [Dryococelus australis]|uniref:C2H2-type domain-containing protein n=1 Tax=Dryococelus australis TaxID=614101 RepID=A0ABQ9H4U6_9NEOP|nr:hypothetical protein PR048_019927 [Dryococelus australis]
MMPGRPKDISTTTTRGVLGRGVKTHPRTVTWKNEDSQAKVNMQHSRNENNILKLQRRVHSLGRGSQRTKGAAELYRLPGGSACRINMLEVVYLRLWWRVCKRGAYAGTPRSLFSQLGPPATEISGPETPCSVYSPAGKARTALPKGAHKIFKTLRRYWSTAEARTYIEFTDYFRNDATRLCVCTYARAQLIGRTKPPCLVEAGLCHPHKGDNLRQGGLATLLQQVSSLEPYGRKMPTMCLVCRLLGKVFTALRNLRRHEITTCGMKTSRMSFQCDFRHMQFSRSDALKRHSETCSTGSPQLKSAPLAPQHCSGNKCIINQIVTLSIHIFSTNREMEAYFRIQLGVSSWDHWFAARHTFCLACWKNRTAFSSRTCTFTPNRSSNRNTGDWYKNCRPWKSWVFFPHEAITKP